MQNTAQLLASIDGVDARFTTDADIQLNVRHGPNTRAELIGTLAPSSITHVMGISADGTWYRIRYQNGYGWVSDRGLKAEVVRANLAAYPADYIEVVTQPQEVAKASTTPKDNTASSAIHTNIQP